MNLSSRYLLSRHVVSLLALLPLGFSALLSAQPKVIMDAGVGVTTADYIRLFQGNLTPDFRESWLFKTAEQNGVVNEVKPVEDLYPITTSRLTPGTLEKEQQVYLVMAYPVCIIGADDFSREWLRRNLVHLKQMNAQCLIVSARDESEVRELIELLDGLPAYPGNGDAIAETFKIEHYPVFITDRFVTQ